MPGWGVEELLLLLLLLRSVGLPVQCLGASYCLAGVPRLLLGSAGCYCRA